MRSPIKSIKVPSIPPYEKILTQTRACRSALDLSIASLFCAAICLWIPLTGRDEDPGRNWKHCTCYQTKTFMCFKFAITTLTIRIKKHATWITFSGGLRARCARPSNRSRCPQSRPCKNINAKQGMEICPQFRHRKLLLRVDLH